MSSRLFQEVREVRGLCYTIFAQSGAYADTGTTTIYAGTSAASGGGTCRDHHRRDEAAPPSDMTPEAELARARAQMKAGMLMGLESPSNRAERLARLVQMWGKVPSLEETVAQD